MTDKTMSCISTEPVIIADSPIRDELPGNELWVYSHRNPKLLRIYCVKLPGKLPAKLPGGFSGRSASFTPWFGQLKYYCDFFRAFQSGQKQNYSSC